MIETLAARPPRKVFAGALLIVTAVSALLPGVTFAAAGYYPYSYDPGFAGGIPLDNRFANVETNDYTGERLARAANGDVVVAGIVPAAGQSTGSNLGLVRYSSDGTRISWTNPTAAYASYFNIYLTWPNSTSVTYTRVDALKIQNGYIYALVDYAASASNSNVYVVVFRDDGTYIGQFGAFTTSLDEHGAGLVPYAFGPSPTERLIAVATYKNGSGNDVLTLKRFSISAGALTVDTSFGPYGNGANDLLIPPAHCDAGAACDISASAVAGVATDSSSPRLYVAASVGTAYSGSSTVYHLAVVGIDGSNGGLLSAVGSNSSGIYYASDESGIGPRSIAATSSGSVGSDLIYLSENYQFCFILSCSESTTLLKLRASTGLPPPSDGTLPVFTWGDGGEVTFAAGGIGAIAADSTQVMAVGGTVDQCADGQGGLFYCGEGTAASFTAASGATQGSNLLPALRSGGGTWSYASWSDIIPGPSGVSFTVAGALGGVPPSDAAQFGTSQIVPDPDGVFRAPFE